MPSPRRGLVQVNAMGSLCCAADPRDPNLVRIGWYCANVPEMREQPGASTPTTGAHVSTIAGRRTAARARYHVTSASRTAPRSDTSAIKYLPESRTPASPRVTFKRYCRPRYRNE